ncbi:Glutamate receptor delta-2 subunit [Trachymyrmex septentrionalis]|uniref:Glutamate receptor delta-2 subunit n=1 Tax=Trachymyrmex septentrionalis TaxID=34720 RepID=A0A195F2A6_9HYME|nr:Glutamate receptor delta-2 subunit [Trachymyrmex septentrionalis]
MRLSLCSLYPMLFCVLLGTLTGNCFNADTFVDLILGIRKFYVGSDAASVIFVHPGDIYEDYGDLRINHLIHTSSRLLSRHYIMTVDVHFKSLWKTLKYYHEIIQPITIVILPDFEAYLEFVDAVKVYSMSFPVWFILFLYTPDNNIHDHCHKPIGNPFNLAFDTQMLVLCNNEIILREWYSIKGDTVKIFDLAEWKDNEGFEFISVINENLMATVFTKVFEELTSHLNFTVNIVSQKLEYGIRNRQTLIWSGVMGEIVYGRADFAIADVALTSFRICFVDFTLPLVVSKINLYFKEPGICGVKWIGYFQTFSSRTWVTIIMLITTAPLLLFFMKTCRDQSRSTVDLISENFICIWGIFCQQALIEFPKSSSLRVAYFTILLAAVLIMAHYSAALICFLSACIHVLPFQTLDEFVNDGTYKLIVIRDSADYDIVTHEENPFYIKLMKLMKDESELPKTLIEGFMQVCNEKNVVFMATSAQKKSLEKKLPCKLSSITTERINNLAIILSKDNPYTGVINYYLQKFLNNGMIMQEISTNNYFRLINDVHRYYRTSCVIFVQSDNYDLKTTTLVHTLSRELSQQRVMIMTITFSNLMSKYNNYQKNIRLPLFVVLLDTEETICEFAKTTKGIKPISFPIWLVVFLQHLGNPLKDYCTHPANNIFNVDVSTQMLILCYNRPILVEWYAIRDNYTKTFDLATWSPDRGLTLRTQENLYARRSDMFGDVVRVTVVNNSPLVTLKNGTMDGFFGLLLIELSKAMNFTIKILDPVDSFGSWDPQNGWSGAIGKLVNNEADIGIAAFTVTNDRLNDVDFSIPLIRTQYRLYLHEPITPYVQWFWYFKVFSPGVCVKLIMIIIIASILLTVIKAKGFSMSIISDNYIKVWGIYCQQGLPEFPIKSSMRLAFFSIYVSSVIILSSYFASLISYLALNTAKLPFSTLEGYVEDGTYKLLVLQNSAEYDIPLYTKDPLLLKMYELREDKEYLPFNLFEGFKKICERMDLAFYTTEVFKNYLSIYIQCELVYINTGRIDNNAITLKKGSPYTGFINYHLRRFQLNGVVNKLKNKNPSTISMKSVGNFTVDITDVTPILTIVIGSTVLSLFILIIEKVYYSFKTPNFKNDESITKFTYNLNVRNKLRKEYEKD